MMDISVVIVNYNTEKCIQECIDSVLMQRQVSFEIIVVDNASQDDSAVVLENYGHKITLIKSQENLGFAKANNLAFKSAQGDYLFLLNPDAFFTTENDLANILNYMRCNSHYGIVSTKILKNDRESLPEKYYPGQKHLLLKELDDLPGEIAWVLGASLIIHGKLYALLKGFDEDYFLYSEDTDLCLRTRKAGYAIGYYPDVVVRHIGGASEKQNNQYNVTTKKQRGMHIFIRKHYSSDNAIKLVKQDLKKSGLQLILLKIKKWLLPLDPAQQIKYAKYQSIYHTSKDFLAR